MHTNTRRELFINEIKEKLMINTKRIKFKDLEIGKLFKYKESVYMKVNGEFLSPKINAIECNGKDLAYFPDDVEVILFMQREVI